MQIATDREVELFNHAYILGFRAGQLDREKRVLVALTLADASSGGINIAISRGNISLEEYSRIMEEGKAS